MLVDLDPADIATLRLMRNWIDRMRVSGDGVRFSNSLQGGFALDIRWPADGPLRQIGGDCLVRLTGTAGGGGKYFGKIVGARAADISYSSDLSMDDIGPSIGDDVLVINTREEAKITHDLDVFPTDFRPVTFVGVRLGPNSDGTQVVAIDGRQSEDCA